MSSLDQLLILARTGDLKKIPTCLVGEHLAGCYHAIYVYSLRSTYLVRIFERRAAIISGVCYKTLTEVVATAFLWVSWIDRAISELLKQKIGQFHLAPVPQQNVYRFW